jgi:methionine--tRNA ligase beta chain
MLLTADSNPYCPFFRYLCKEAPYGGELSFSEESMRDMHNADLCDNIGNLVNRATSLCSSYCGGVLPYVPAPAKSPISLQEVVDSYTTKMNNFELQGGANVAAQGFRDVNGYLQDEAPWLKKGDEFEQDRQIVVRATLEAIYALAHLLLPFLPIGAAKIFEKLNTEPTNLQSLNKDSRNLKVGTKIVQGDVLYSKSMSAEEMHNVESAASQKKESHAEAQARKKEAKAQMIAKSKSGSEVDQPEFTKIEIRVGKIVKVWNHAEADKLFCEQVDLGEETGPREIASGLRNFYSLEEMQDRKVLVVCNLKSAKIVGFASNGMVLAAKAADGTKVELVDPPEDAVIGERVFVEGLSGEPVSSTQVKKKKIWEAVAKDLLSGEGGVATWGGKMIQTTAGPCKVASLVGAPIS